MLTIHETGPGLLSLAFVSKGNQDDNIDLVLPMEISSVYLSACIEEKCSYQFEIDGVKTFNITAFGRHYSLHAWHQ